MRLSESIRLGSMLHPQNLDGFMWDNGRTCALGAACDAVGIVDPDPNGDDSEDVMHMLRLEFPILNEETHCPACSLLAGIYRRWKGEEYDLEDVIIHLNDDHKWKRERIAKWVSTVEHADEVPTTEDVAAHEHVIHQ
jgi:hypothetical protein